MKETREFFVTTPELLGAEICIEDYTLSQENREEQETEPCEVHYLSMEGTRFPHILVVFFFSCFASNCCEESGERYYHSKIE